VTESHSQITVDQDGRVRKFRRHWPIPRFEPFLKARDIADFIKIFEKFSEGIWWFPHTLIGGVAGDIKISGGLSMDKLTVTGNFTGPNWECLGEKFRPLARTSVFEKLMREHYLRGLKDGLQE